jgi:hypothetical protein
MEEGSFGRPQDEEKRGRAGGGGQGSPSLASTRATMDLRIESFSGKRERSIGRARGRKAELVAEAAGGTLAGSHRERYQSYSWFFFIWSLFSNPTLERRSCGCRGWSPGWLAPTKEHKPTDLRSSVYATDEAMFQCTRANLQMSVS